jgi:putative transposase
METWRAGCGESRTSGSEGGPEKPTDGNARTALRSDPYTYIPLKRGFLYLVAVMDWASRKVLSWRLSNTLEPSFCVEALEEALGHYGVPEIFNTDQGSQFTSLQFTRVLKEAGVRISMDGKGRWMDNVFIERLWRSLKYECVYLSEYTTGSEARAGIDWWMDLYNERRPHSALGDHTPEEAYWSCPDFVDT